MTAASAPPAPRATTAEATAVSAPARWKQVVIAIPDAMLVPMLWLCVTVSVTIILGVFTPWLVLPVVLVGSALTWRWRPTPFRARFAWQSSLAAVIGVAGWLAVNLPFASPWVYVSRDPGFLTLEGYWLSRHSYPNIPSGNEVAITHELPGTIASGLAYFLQDDELHAQGAKLVPGLAAIGGWVGGIDGVLVSNLCIGALALLFVYGCARRLVGPIWSLGVIAALGVSMPFVAFTRSIYTEPLVVAVTFGGLTALWVAYRTGRWQHFLLGGGLVGAGGLARIDGAALVIGLVIGTALAAFGARDAAWRARLRRGYFIAAGMAVALTAVGLVDLYLDSPGYLSDLAGQWHELVAALIASVVIGSALVFTHPWERARAAVHRFRRPLGVAAAIVVAVIAVVLISRPLWYVGVATSNPLIGTLQPAIGQPVDDTRSYDEQSVTWLAMYYSWIVVAAGFLGAAWGAARALVRRDGAMLVFLGVIILPSLLYFWKSSISPDQIWAMRRYLPVTIPGFLILAAWFLRGASSWLAGRAKIASIGGRTLVAGVAVAGFGFAAVPFATSNTFQVVQYGGQYDLVENVCRAVAGRPVIIVDNTQFLATIRSVCEVPAIEYVHRATADELEQARTAWKAREPVVIAFEGGFVPWESGAVPPPWETATIDSWQLTLNARPTGDAPATWELWLGTIDEGGDVVPLPPR